MGNIDYKEQIKNKNNEYEVLIKENINVIKNLIFPYGEFSLTTSYEFYTFRSIEIINIYINIYKTKLKDILCFLDNDSYISLYLYYGNFIKRHSNVSLSLYTILQEQLNFCLDEMSENKTNYFDKTK